MALTIGSTKLRGNGQPFQLWEVAVVLDGTLTSASSIAHTIPNATFPPDWIIRLDGGTASSSAAVIQNVSAGVQGASTVTHFGLVLAGAAAASQTILLGFGYFNQF